MIMNILPEPRPLGLLGPRRSPPSCPGSLSSVHIVLSSVHSCEVHSRVMPDPC